MRAVPSSLLSMQHKQENTHMDYEIGIKLDVIIRQLNMIIELLGDDMDEEREQSQQSIQKIPE